MPTGCRRRRVVSEVDFQVDFTIREKIPRWTVLSVWLRRAAEVMNSMSGAYDRARLLVLGGAQNDRGYGKADSGPKPVRGTTGEEFAERKRPYIAGL